jgi:predicted GIY-YIG superfamily endonuclease
MHNVLPPQTNSSPLTALVNPLAVDNLLSPDPRLPSSPFANTPLINPLPAVTSSDAAPQPFTANTEVYILELEGGRVYVGSSKDINRRIAQHTAGSGSAYTRAYKPTGVRLPRLGNVAGSGDAAERDETLRYMHQRGIQYVRGWRFSQVAMKTEEFMEAEANIRELFNLCRRCGYQGHFINRCKATYDRWGMQCSALNKP